MSVSEYQDRGPITAPFELDVTGLKDKSVIITGGMFEVVIVVLRCTKLRQVQVGSGRHMQKLLLLQGEMLLKDSRG